MNGEQPVPGMAAVHTGGRDAAQGDGREATGRFGFGQEMPPRRLGGAKRAMRANRVVIVGSDASVAAFQNALARSPTRRYEFVGQVDPNVAADAPSPPPATLGRADALCSIIEEHDVQLILLASDAPRMSIFEQLMTPATLGRVRLASLAHFCEENFGYIPMSEINAAWFQCILHPRHRPTRSAVKRTFDVMFVMIVALLSLPVLALAALAIKIEGGPVLYRQRRIGQHGTPFWLFKLRTMRALEDETARWCEPNDPRVTRVGRILRRLHLDELPQLYNVLRGDMSMVGPRPEQPEMVAHLIKTLPFYSLRHLVKPGVTGWAQVRCGYAGSDHGSWWKLCHDLYYIKRRSLLFDLSLMIATVWAIAREGTPVEARPAVLLEPATSTSDPG